MLQGPCARQVAKTGELRSHGFAHRGGESGVIVNRSDAEERRLGARSSSRGGTGPLKYFGFVTAKYLPRRPRIGPLASRITAEPGK
jgi:hypothetical protein